MQEANSQNAKKLHCPNCKSHNIAISTETSIDGAVTSSFGGSARVASTRFNNTHRNYWFCSDCGSKFRNIQNLEEEIAKVKNKKICMTKLFNPLLKLMGVCGGKFGGLVNKAFGNMVYEKEMSTYCEEYQIYDLDESIRLTEGTE